MSFRSVLLLLFFSVGFCSIPSNGADGTWQDFVKRHEASSDKLYALSAELSISREVFNNKKIDPVQPIRRVKWAFDDGKLVERQQGWLLNLPQLNDEGAPFNCYDIMVDEHQSRSLLNWDWERPRRLNPPFQGPLRAVYGKREELLRGSAIFPRCFLLLQVQADNADQPRSIRQFLNASPEVKFASSNEDGFVIVKAKHPDFATKSEYAGYRVEMHFDPSAENMLRRFIVHLPPDETGTAWTQDTRVIKFAAFQNVMLPTELLMKYGKSTGEFVTIQEQTRISDISVNEQVSEDAFDFRFPHNSLVVNSEISPDGDQDRYQMFLWGDDNKPAHELSSATELAKYADAGTPEKTPDSGRWLLAVNAAILIAGLLVWTLRRKQSGVIG